MQREVACVVQGVEKHILPRVYKVNCRIDSGGGLVFEYHEELELSYSQGERLLVRVSDQKIQPQAPSDYCGKAFLYKVIDQESEKVYLFSVGGYIFRFSLPQSVDDLKVAESYYICVSKA